MPLSGGTPLPTTMGAIGHNQATDWLLSLPNSLLMQQQRQDGSPSMASTTTFSTTAATVASISAPTSEPEFRVRQRVSLACLPCRSRHVKCDSGFPTCSRCKFDGRQCKYMQSRRGGHNKIRDTKPTASSTPAAPAALASKSGPTIQQWQHGISSSEQPSRAPTLAENQSTSSTSSLEDLESLSTLNAVAFGGDNGTPPIMDPLVPDTSLECYFSHFHQPHPIALPKQHFTARLASGDRSLETVVTVMRYIGSLIGNLPFVDSFKSAAETLLFSTQLAKTGFSVQALMLYSIATHWNNEKVRAREILDIAGHLALDIGMHMQSFAYQHGEGSVVLEESWRRTWWLLYVVDSLYAGIRHETSFKLWSVSTDVELPCEEECYLSGNIPQPRTMVDFDNREFEAEDIVFSSFAYLIDASRILGTTLAVSADVGDLIDPRVDNADAGLVAWAFHLPDVKKEMVAGNGKVDPILFLAHMLIHTTTIYLHRPRSKLIYSSAENISKCAPPPPPDRISIAKQEAYQLHTTKVLAASEEISKLLALPTPLVKQSQFIICMVALSTIAQLSACLCDLIPTITSDSSNNSSTTSSSGSNSGSRAMKDRIRVNIGALKAHAKIWILGRKTLYEVKLIARYVFALQKLDLQSIAELAGDSDEFGPLSMDGWSSVDGGGQQGLQGGGGFGDACFVAQPMGSAVGLGLGDQL
ncbi:hypothetical protein AJ80_09163 [Polytolypa hystricis UAMH7299]|uniref:Zn(2)-C6 fungal-type domain-containing protein n=1 Tax=Polytolypa hystricis (strain UAMH7299) TaxID=1447883 RepID=A0A2B7WVH5_POLH7|nr:hypothetical protein AJ80_09163 [Polytolypa hystricis UAMH7299]